MRNVAPPPLSEPRAELFLKLILIVYLILGALYATVTPAWQSPDEPAHFNYVRDVAEKRQLPELRPGDYPAQYLEEIKARRFPPEMSIDPLRYESHQPPLYYLLAALVYRLADALFRGPWPLALRAFSLLIGAATLAISYRLVRVVYPSEPVLALSATAFAALLPMHLAMTASVNNDVLAELILAFILWRLVAMDARAWTNRRAFGLGALLGLAFLTKIQSYSAFVVALATLLWDTIQACRSGAAITWRIAFVRAVVMFGTAFAVALPWLMRNVSLYGLADPLALARHDQVVVGQLTTGAYLAEHGWLSLIKDWALTTFRSFWGQFGWMGVLLDQRLYIALAILTGLATFGAILYGLRLIRGQDEPLAPQTARAWLLLGVWVLMTLCGYLWWNTKFVQHQGRYLFPALPALALAFTLGLRELWRGSPKMMLWPVGAVLLALLIVGAIAGHVQLFSLGATGAAGVAMLVGSRLERWKPGLAFACTYLGMAALAVLCLYGFILPALRV